MIESVNNPSVKLAASLAVRKYRDRHGLLLIEGGRAIHEALRFDADIRFVLFESRWNTSSIIDKLRKREVKCLSVTPDVMQRVAATENPQGIIAVAARPDKSFPDDAKIGRLLVIDRVQDPGNMGTIIRTAAAVSVEGIVISKDSVDPANPKAIRASAGAFFALPIKQSMDTKEINALLRKMGLTSVAADANGEVDAFSYDWTRPHALIVGNEAHGVDEDIDVDVRVALPMPGRVESLNAAVATTVLLYEALRANLIK